jgi:hypothetical protein
MAQEQSTAEHNRSAKPKIAKRSQSGAWLAMTSFRQIEANRRNALKSTGPRTEAGKQASCANAFRHGLTAETVIGTLEDAEDYKAFEAAVTADYDAQSAVERELVLRLASVLWRLRRAATMETGLLDIQAGHLDAFRQTRKGLPARHDVHGPSGSSTKMSNCDPTGPNSTTESSGPPASPADLACCFLRLANLPNFALDRLSRYEAALWRQASQILYALEILDRRKPQERAPHFRFVELPGRDEPA